MNRETWQHVVDEARNGNEALFNKAVTSNFRDQFYMSILKTVHEEELTHEIYNFTMFKFWERFILRGEDLPESNIDGYIYQMSRNAFYEIKRQKSNQRNLNTVSMESQELIEKYKDLSTSDHLDYDQSTTDKSNLHYTLHEAVRSLDDKCQEIINRHIIEGNSLVQLKEEMAMYGSYNAIVQKKKRCIRKLYKLLQIAIKEKKIIIPQL